MVWNWWSPPEKRLSGTSNGSRVIDFKLIAVVGLLSGEVITFTLPFFQFVESG